MVGPCGCDKSFAERLPRDQWGIRRIAVDEKQKADARNTAMSLYETMAKLETGIFAQFWNDLLQRFNSMSKKLQSESIDLNTAVDLQQSPSVFICRITTRWLWWIYVTNGGELSGTSEFTVHRARKRNTRLNPLDYGKAENTSLEPKDSFRIQSYITVIDVLLAELDKRKRAYKEVADRFGFLHNLKELSDNDIQAAARKLVETYVLDLDDGLGNELIQFKSFLNEEHTEAAMYELIFARDIEDVFPNTEVVLRIYMSIMATNCSGERSFSKLKLIKDDHRSTMSQQCLVDLTILTSESDVMREIDLNRVLSDFAQKQVINV